MASIQSLPVKPNNHPTGVQHTRGMKESELEFSPTPTPLLLRKALDPLHQSTGVDFFGLYEDGYDISPHPDARRPGTNQPEEKESVRESVTDVPDLKDFFRAGVPNRKFFRYVDRVYNPEKEDAKLKDYLIMEEERTDGGKVLAIFDYPPEHYWRNIKIKGREIKFPYLNLRFVARVTADSQAVASRELDRAEVLTPCLTDEESIIKTIGLSAEGQPEDERRYDVVVLSQAVLLRDIEPRIGRVHLGKKDLEVPLNDFWNNLATFADEEEIRQLGKWLEGANLQRLLETLTEITDIDQLEALFGEAGTGIIFRLQTVLSGLSKSQLGALARGFGLQVPPQKRK